MALRMTRRFTREGKSPYASIPFRVASSEIRNPDGSVVFQLERAEVPAAWSQVAVDVLAQKYFRKAGIPARLRPVREKGVPSWLARRVADEKALAELPRTSGRAARPMPSRFSTAWPAPGPIGAGRAAISRRRTTPAPSWTSFATCWRKQMAAPNSPQWFNTGLHWAYGIDGPAPGSLPRRRDDRRGEGLDLGL